MKRLLTAMALAMAVFASAAMAQGKAKDDPAVRGKSAAKKSGEKLDEAATQPDKGKPKKDRGGKDKDKASEDADKGRDKADKSDARGPEKVVGNIVRQMEREEAKHRKRVARLEVVRDKLTEKGNTEAAARVDQVLAKENQRYQRAMERLKAHNDEATAKFQDKMQKLGEREKADKDKPSREKKGGPKDEK